MTRKTIGGAGTWMAADYGVAHPEVLHAPEELPKGFAGYHRYYRMEIMLWLWACNAHMPWGYEPWAKLMPGESPAWQEFNKRQVDSGRKSFRFFDHTMVERTINRRLRLGHLGRIEAEERPMWCPTLVVLNRDGRPDVDRAEHILRRIHERIGLDRGAPFMFERTGHKLTFRFRTPNDNPHDITPIVPGARYQPDPEDAFLPWEAMWMVGDGFMQMHRECWAHVGLTYEMPEYVEAVNLDRFLRANGDVFEFSYPGQTCRGDAWAGVQFELPSADLTFTEQLYGRPRRSFADEDIQMICREPSALMNRVMFGIMPYGAFYAASHEMGRPILHRMNWQQDPWANIGVPGDKPSWGIKRGSFGSMPMHKREQLRQSNFQSPYSFTPGMPWNQSAVMDADLTCEQVRMTKDIMTRYGCDFRIERSLATVGDAEAYLREWLLRAGAYGLHFLVIQRDGTTVTVRTRNWWCDPLPDLDAWNTHYTVPDQRIARTRIYDPRRDSPAWLPPRGQVHRRIGFMNPSQAWWESGEIVI